METLKRLFQYLRPYWRQLALSIILTFLVIGLTLSIPALFGRFFDKVILLKNLFYLKLIVAASLLVIGLKGFFSYSQSYLMNFVGLSALKKLREEAYAKLMRLPLLFFESWPTGDLFSRLTNDIAILTDVMSTSIVYLVNDLFVVVGSLGIMLWRSPKLTLLTLIVTPAIAISVSRFGRWMHQVTHSMQTRIAELSQISFEGISCIPIVKAFGRESDEIERFKNKNEDYFTWSMKAVQVMFTQTPVVEFLTVVGIAIMVYYGGYEIIHGKLTTGQLVEFWGYMAIATNPFYRFSSNITNLRKAQAASSRIFEIIDAQDEPEVEPLLGGREPALPFHVQGKIEYAGVWFRYHEDKPWVLEDVNLTIRPGQMVAVVGPSGAGKSSMMALIPRFYKPTLGTILIDGVETRRIPLSQLRAHIGIVSQEVLLFSRTVRENIAYGVPNASVEEIVHAARVANAHDFIQQLPNGYETILGERGMTLSGGQRQRLAIARAVLTNPKILILDEATSNLDSESERLIQEALQRVIVGRTTFVIAHRLSTIRHADKIISLEKGKIVEIGAHGELLGKSGLYSRLVEAQGRFREA